MNPTSERKEERLQLARQARDLRRIGQLFAQTLQQLGRERIGCYARGLIQTCERVFDDGCVFSTAEHDADGPVQVELVLQVVLAFFKNEDVVGPPDFSHQRCKFLLSLIY